MIGKERTKQMKRKKRNKKELKEKAEIFALCFIALIILCIGCHYEATYVSNNCKVISVTETSIEVENLNNHVTYECEATGTENISINEIICCKFTNECTGTPYDDYWIDYGNHCFWCFVW